MSNSTQCVKVPFGASGSSRMRTKLRVFKGAPPHCSAFEAHLAVCEGCRTYLEQMQRTITAVGTLSEDSLSLSDRERLLDLFRAWKQAAP